MKDGIRKIWLTKITLLSFGTSIKYVTWYTFIVYFKLNSIIRTLSLKTVE